MADCQVIKRNKEAGATNITDAETRSNFEREM
jgi:hypothetical protein